MQLLVAGRLQVGLPALLAHHANELGVDVAPFAHAAHIDVVLAQQVFVLPVGQLVPRIGGRGTGLALT